jgi:WD40 repeat protein
VASVPLRQRVVEVIADLGKTSRPRWRYGSGLLVGGRQVLTAAHVVAGAAAVTVRGPDKVALPADLDSALLGDPDHLDFALLAVPAAPALPKVAVALVDRDVTTGEVVIEGCWAVGYPSFQEVARDVAGSVRETAQVRGWIPPLSGLVEGLLSLQVTATPQSLPAEQTRLGESEWSGMSGAAVFAREALVGVVTEHAPRRGSSEVTVIPLDQLSDPATAPADAAGWWGRLGVDDPAGLPRLPAVPARPEPAYRATLRRLRGRTKMLVGREAELAQITAFAGGADDAFGRDTVSDGYLWLVGGPWAGKTALLAEAVQAMPGSVDVVAFFLVAREGRASREEFLGAVVPQSAWLLDEDPPAAVDVDVFNDLWERAAQRAEERDRRLLLVVDGLDEDLRPDRRSVAALLPKDLGVHARVLVASRPYPELPSDVEASHPLRTIQDNRTQVPLQKSPHASKLQVLAEQEIDRLLESVPARDAPANLIQDVLGVLTAAAGPLSVEDLAALTSDPKRVIREFVTKQAGRSLEPVGPDNDRCYQFAHQTLLRLCEGHPDIGGEPQYRNRLHAWAEHWRDQGWPAPGRNGAGTPRYLLDAYPAILAGDPTDPLRPAHPERLTTLVSDINWVDSAVCRVGVDGVLAALRTAAQFSPVQASVASMLRLLQLQADHLRPPSGMNRPGGAATQLAWEALRNDLPDLTRAAARRLRRSPAPLLIPMWTTERTSPYLVRVLGRHDGWVYAVAVGPDGRVVTGGGDGLRLWDPATPGQPGQQLGRHDSRVQAVAVGPDGQVVTGGEDGVVWLWDPATPGQPGQQLGRHDGWVYAVAVGPDGRAVSGGDDRRVLVWDAAAPGADPVELGRHDGRVYAVAVGPDGQVVTGGEDGVVWLWDLATPGQPGQQLGRHDSAVYAVAVGPDGQVVTVTGEEEEDGVVWLWDPATPGQPARELGRRVGAPLSVAVGPDGQVVTGGIDGVVSLWDLGVPSQPGQELGGQDGAPLSVAVGPDGRVVTGGEDGVVWLWDPAAPEPGQELGRHDGRVYAVAVGPDGQVVTGGEDGVVWLWDLAAPGQPGQQLGRHDSAVYAVAVGRDGQVVTGGEDGGVWLWDLATPGQPAQELGRHDIAVLSVAVGPDGQVVTGGEEGVRLWDLAAPGQPARELGRGDGAVGSLVVGPDGRVVTGEEDGVVWLWDPAAPEPGQELGRHDGWVNTVVVGPDGRVVTGGEDGEVRLWDLAAPGQPAQELGRHDSSVSVAIGPDGRVVIAGRGVTMFEMTSAST